MVDLNSIQQQLQKKDAQNPPLEQWHPEFCGDIDMHIDQEGRWFYMGSPIGREALVKLFARVLWREDDRYFLLTPVEKVGITVADVPFLVTDWHFAGEARQIEVVTNVGDSVIISDNKQMELRDAEPGVPVPYVLIRRNLWARLNRNVYYQWLEQAQERDNQLVLTSGSTILTLGSMPSN